MAFIRPYKPSDFDAAAHICRETLATSLQGSTAAWRLSPYLWTHPYTHLSPETCFVLDDGTGRAVGYCIGCPDVEKLIEAYPTYARDILARDKDISTEPESQVREEWLLPGGQVNPAALVQTARDPQRLLVEGNESLVRGDKYGATMHIDLLEGWRGGGWGRKLIERFAEAVQSKGARGIWIGVAGDNGKAVGFYERIGFKVLDRGRSIRMVRDLE